MKRDVLIGMDYGTNGAKALAYSVETGKVVSQAYQGYPVYYPPPNLAEHDPADWWQAFKLALANLLKNETFKAEQIACISVSAHTPSLLPMDNAGQPLSRAAIWADARSEKEAASIIERLGDKIKRINPAAIRPYHMVAKIEWLRTQRPDIFAKTKYFLQCNTYINYRLTGVYSIDHSMAGNCHFYNIYTRTWDKEICESLHIPFEMLPPVSESYDIIGHVSKEAAEETGLSPETLVAAGTTDTAAATLGAGIYKEGQTGYSTGTGSTLVQVVAIPKNPGSMKIDPALISIPAVIPGFILNTAVMGCTGGALKWFRKALGQSETALEDAFGIDAYSMFDREAERTATGSGGLIFIPYLTGELSPIWNSKARGVFFGLGDSTTRGEILRSIMEGSCYSFRHNMDIINPGSGTAIKEITATGGPCNSKFWMQALADCNGVEIQTLQKCEGAAMGDVIISGLGTGVFKDVKDAFSTVVEYGAKYTPNPAEKLKYDSLFNIYKSLVVGLKDNFAALAEWRDTNLSL
ncbi:xylulokinase [Spirochaetia bacterium]|nr:xylulokinase [Spirochaetia bacterium]